MTKLEIFAEMMKENFYFSDEVHGTNHLEWNNDKTCITIYNNDCFEVHGIGVIGQAAEALNLCCTAYWNMCDRRLEVRVH